MIILLAGALNLLQDARNL